MHHVDAQMLLVHETYRDLLFEAVQTNEIK